MPQHARQPLVQTIVDELLGRGAPCPIDGKGPRDMARFVEGDVMLRRVGARGALLQE